MTVLLVALGAALGAPLRYLTDRAISARHDSLLPWGTLTVNVAGSLLLGFLAAAAAAGHATAGVTALVGTGFCGALTTYSTFGYETTRLVEDGARLYAAASIAGNVVGGLAAAAAGWAVATALWS